jgi:hypothetical protein
MMPAMKPPVVKTIENEEEAKIIIRYLGLSAVERKALQKDEKTYKALLRPYMDDRGYSKITANDGSTATLEDTSRAVWDYEAIAMRLGVTVTELKKMFSKKTTGTRLTCRPPA